MNHINYDTGFRKYLATNHTSDAAASGVAPATFSATRHAHMIYCAGVTKMLLAFYGSDADGEDFRVNVFGVYSLGMDGQDAGHGYISTKIAVIDVQCGTLTGADGTFVPATNLWCDVVAVADPGVTETLDFLALYQPFGRALGDINTIEYSPADNTIGLAAVPCAGMHGLVFTFDLDGNSTQGGAAAASANLLYKPDVMYG